MANLRTPALVLRKYDYGETSQVLHFMTRDRGRVHVLAKGAHRPKSSLGGPLDILERGTARLRIKGQGLALLTGFDREDAFPAIRRDLDRLEAGFAVLEVLHHSSRENHADPELFDLGLAALGEIARCPAARLPAVVLRFDLRALDVLGLAPVLDACVFCEGDILREKHPLLSPARGGALCARCREHDHLALPVRPPVLAALARLAAPDPAALKGLHLAPADLRDARRLTADLLRHTFEREIRKGV